MKKVQLQLRVETFDIDAMGHVSNISYIRWLEMARCSLLEACGVPIAELMKLGFGPALVRTEIDYRRPVFLGDEVELSMWISELSSTSAWLDFEILANQKLATTARQRGLFVSLETGRPHRLTDEQKAWFVPYSSQ